MSRATFLFRAAQLNILVLCAVLLGGFAFQFVSGELPCPLCMLQRHAMMLCALGPAFLIARARHGEMQYRDVATGYGLTVLAAVAGASVSVRQILLHIVPPDPGYGGTVLGLHVYTWALLVFVAELIAAGLNLTFAGGLEGRRIEWGTDSRLVLGLLGFAILANAAVVFVEAGLHVSLDDNPDRYKLFSDLGILRSSPSQR